MPNVTFVAPDGRARTCAAEDGATLMETAIAHEVEGIVAFCGGMCSCGTCHCYLPDAWAERVPPPDENELDTLKRVLDRRPSSRLACQLRLDAALEGLTVTVPARQRSP